MRETPALMRPANNSVLSTEHAKPDPAETEKSQMSKTHQAKPFWSKETEDVMLTENLVKTEKAEKTITQPVVKPKRQ